MKNNNVDEEKVIFKVFSFPEKLNVIINVLIVILVIFITTVVCIYGLPERDYNYIPNNEEVLEYDYINPWIQIYNNYSYSEDKLVNKPNLTYKYSGYNNEKSAKYFMGSYVVIFEDGTIKYSGETNASYGDTSTSGTSSTQYSDTNITGVEAASNIKAIDGKLRFRKYENNKNLDSEYTTVTLHEDFITLTKEDKNHEVINDFENFKVSSESGEEVFFKTLNVSKSINTSKTDYYSNKFNLIVNSSIQGLKYHVDLQAFALTDLGEYNVVGIYNFCNNKTNQATVTFETPINMGIKYIIIKCNVTINGVKTTLLYKQPYSEM